MFHKILFFSKSKDRVLLLIIDIIQSKLLLLSHESIQHWKSIIKNEMHKYL